MVLDWLLNIDMRLFIQGFRNSIQLGHQPDGDANQSGAIDGGGERDK
jgi:hypothetical protein